MGTRPPLSEHCEPGAGNRTSQTTQRLLRVLELLPPIAYWDTELRNRAANTAFAEFFAVSPQAIEGKHIRDVLWPDLAELALPYFERMLATGEPQRFDRTSVDARGVRSHAQVELLPDVVDGELSGVVSIATDVTAHREAELALAASQQRLEQAEQLAQQALQSASSHLADRARELAQLAAGSRASAEPAAPDAGLSERHLEILQLVAQGFTNAQIAQRLYISETTVKWHIRQILVKTNSSNRAEAVAHVLGVRQL